jgi:thymidine phosphorylase
LPSFLHVIARKLDGLKTPILGPLVASAGVYYPTLSGRGLDEKET